MWAERENVYRPCKPTGAIFCDTDDTFAVVCVQDKTSDSAEQAGFLWEKVTELSSAGIVKIVDFAKKIPGFLTLSTSDQITLLKAACLEIMVSMWFSKLVYLECSNLKVYAILTIAQVIVHWCP